VFSSRIEHDRARSISALLQRTAASLARLRMRLGAESLLALCRHSLRCDPDFA
jgi:hypothetical protein